MKRIKQRRQAQTSDRERCHARATAKRRWLTLHLICSLNAGHDGQHHDTYQWVSWDNTPTS